MHIFLDCYLSSYRKDWAKALNTFKHLDPPDKSGGNSASGPTSKVKNTAAEAMDVCPKLETLPPERWTDLKSAGELKSFPKFEPLEKLVQNIAAGSMNGPPRHYF
jgi:hypothetical protein